MLDFDQATIEAVARGRHQHRHDELFHSPPTWEHLMSMQREAYREEAESILTALNDADFLVVPKLPTDAEVEAADGALRSLVESADDGWCEPKPPGSYSGYAHTALTAARRALEAGDE